jgi:hypothetical protein
MRAVGPQDLGHFRVQGRQNLGRHLDDGDFHAEMQKVVGHLNADEAAPDDGRALHLVLLDVRFNPDRGGDRPDGKDAGRIDPGDRRPEGRGAGREDELVIGLAIGLPVARFLTRTVFCARSIDSASLFSLTSMPSACISRGVRAIS